MPNILGSAIAFVYLLDCAGAEVTRQLLSPRFRRLATNQNKCNGKFECSGYFVGNFSVAKCAYGHKEQDGNCDTPCNGVRTAPCSCLTEDEAIEGVTNISLQSIGISAAVLVIGGFCAFSTWKKMAAVRRMALEPPEDRSQDYAASEPSATVIGDTNQAGGSLGDNNLTGPVPEPRFTDTAGDEVVLRLEGMDVNMYLNGRLEIGCLRSSSDVTIDMQNRTYRIKEGGGAFGPLEDLAELGRQIDQLFSAHAAVFSGAPPGGVSPPGGLSKSHSKAEIMTQASGQMARMNPQKVNMIRMIAPLIIFAALGYGLYNVATKPYEFYESYGSFMGLCSMLCIVLLIIGNILARMGQMRWNTCDVTAADNPVLIGMKAVRQIWLMAPFVGLLGIAWAVYRLANPGSVYHDDCLGLLR